MTNLQEDFSAGKVLLIDKPYTWTSFDVVKKIRNTIKIKKVGHAGTLDPLASGLLIVCTGKKTKSINTLQDMEKEYTGEMTLGITTPSYDGETEPDAYFDMGHLNEALLHETAKTFEGEIEQIPPAFSAIKINGERVYKKAREGQEVKMQPRPVHIYRFAIEAIDWPTAHFRVVCSKGTYIRSLVHDFGKALNSGAYLTGLRRTRIGDYTVEDSMTIEAFVQSYKKQAS